MMQQYYSCGKLLITGEYLVLRGARGLALPTSRGQMLEVSNGPQGRIIWHSKDDNGRTWFKGEFDSVDLGILNSTDMGTSLRLKAIFDSCRTIDSNAFNVNQGYSVETRLEFPRDWGLGSSSTLVNSIAQWTGVDPFQLHELSMSGSGYDVKVAELGKPLVFWKEGDMGKAQVVDFDPSFQDSIWFVHLGKKKDSAEEVKSFSDMKVSGRDIDQVSRISLEISQVQELAEFIRSLREHDLLLSRILAIPSANEVFEDYPNGYCKYLGAWGGDFMLVTGKETDMDFFRQKGYGTILSYKNMIQI